MGNEQGDCLKSISAKYVPEAEFDKNFLLRAKQEK
jgi:hypothetical protein